MNVRGEVHAYLVPEDYRRLRLEALARGVSLSKCAGDCLAEYFALRQEMATAFETPDQVGPLAPPRVIHVLLAQTEQRLVATLERYGEDLTAVRAELAAVLAMLDRSHFTYLCYTPEMPRGSPRPGLCQGPAALRGLAQRRGAHPEGVRSAGTLAPGGLGRQPTVGRRVALTGPHQASPEAGRPPRPGGI